MPEVWKTRVVAIARTESLDQLLKSETTLQPIVFEITNKTLKELCKRIEKLPPEDQNITLSFMCYPHNWGAIRPCASRSTSDKRESVRLQPRAATITLEVALVLGAEFVESPYDQDIRG
jgi:hypothetical protein